MSFHQKSNYERICSACDHSAGHGELSGPWCKIPRDLVTGQQIKISCRNGRTMAGHCGPGGKYFEVRTEPVAISAEPTPKLTRRIKAVA